MPNKEVVLTYEGLKKLEEELDYLKSVKRIEVAEKIKQALAFGDISENAEYDEAKNEQANLEIRIVNVEAMLRNAKVIDDDEVSTDAVSVGSKTRLLDMEFDEEVEYYLVGSTEADPSQFKISNESPLGIALLGKKVGEIAEVVAPDGVIKFKVLKIYK